jgi:chloramphenicol-sensitive protein RarD
LAANATTPGSAEREPLHHRDTPTGLIYGLISYIWWGLMPLYLNLVKDVPAELLAWRVVTSLVVLALMLWAARRLPEFSLAFRRPAVRRALIATTILIAINWYVYFYAVSIQRTVDASLGYFIQPLFNALIGAVWFREHFRPMQKVATAIAAIGMLMLVVMAQEWPWIAFSLVLSFGLYTTIRKVTPVDGLVGLSIEVVLLVPIALVYLLWIWHDGTMVFGSKSRAFDGWLLASGIITAIPMICFGQAARRLKLSTLGFIQYLSPTLQFIMALTILGEPFDAKKMIGYIIVWCALLIYIIDTINGIRAKRRAGRATLVNLAN